MLATGHVTPANHSFDWRLVSSQASYETQRHYKHEHNFGVMDKHGENLKQGCKDCSFVKLNQIKSEDPDVLDLLSHTCAARQPHPHVTST